MIEKQLKEIQNKFLKLSQQVEQSQLLANAKSIDSLGDVIRTERKKQKLSLHDLSDLSGVSYSTIVKIEANDEGVSLRLLKNVVSTLGLNLWIG